jgi:hypothetical protein
MIIILLVLFRSGGSILVAATFEFFDLLHILCISYAYPRFRDISGLAMIGFQPFQTLYVRV